VTPLAGKIRTEILQSGPIAFSRFMELALYDPQFGYYRRRNANQGGDPFGRSGDFFTAEQLQPVFGRLIASAVADLRKELGSPEEFALVEIGAGRGEMADALEQFRYIPVDVDRGEVPSGFTGVVFSNEFFDALPVDVAIRSGSSWRQRRVGLQTPESPEARFEFVPGPPVDERALRYLERYAASEQQTVEVHFRAVEWIQRMAERLARGYVLTIDYGYTGRESIRFPDGTLMGYRRHTATEDVLEDPGNRDITSHVPFTVLQEAGEQAGLKTVSLETLSQFLLRLGESRFEEAIAGGHSLQLKTLLYGLGETFRVLLQHK